MTHEKKMFLRKLMMQALKGLIRNWNNENSWDYVMQIQLIIELDAAESKQKKK